MMDQTFLCNLRQLKHASFLELFLARYAPCTINAACSSDKSAAVYLFSCGFTNVFCFTITGATLLGNISISLTSIPDSFAASAVLEEIGISAPLYNPGGTVKCDS